MTAESFGVDDLAAAYVSAVSPALAALREYQTRVGSIERTVLSLTDLVSAGESLAAAMNVSHTLMVAIAWPDTVRLLVAALMAAADDYLALLNVVGDLNTVRDATAWIDDVNDARLRSVDAANILRAALGLPAFSMLKVVEAGRTAKGPARQERPSPG